MLDANKSILKWVPSDHDPEADSVLGIYNIERSVKNLSMVNNNKQYRYARHGT